MTRVRGHASTIIRVPSDPSARCRFFMWLCQCGQHRRCSRRWRAEFRRDMHAVEAQEYPYKHMFWVCGGCTRMFERRTDRNQHLARCPKWLELLE